jgi:hypothetical protein
MIGSLVQRAGRGLTAAAAVVAIVAAMTGAPQPANAVSPGAAVGIGLGAFALGSVLASPYYYGGGYPGYYGYPAYYYPPAPCYYYPPPRNCWNPYYGRYYPC